MEEGRGAGHLAPLPSTTEPLHRPAPRTRGLGGLCRLPLGGRGPIWDRLSSRTSGCLLLLHLLPQAPCQMVLWGLFSERDLSSLSLRPGQQCKEVAWPCHGPCWKVTTTGPLLGRCCPLLVLKAGAAPGLCRCSNSVQRLAQGEEAQKGHLLQSPHLGVGKLEVRSMGVGVGGHDFSRSHSKLAAESGLEFRVPTPGPAPYCRPLRSWLPLLRGWEHRSRHPEQEAPLALPPAPPRTLRPPLLAILLHGGPHAAKAASPSCQAAAPVLSQTGKGQLQRFHGNSRGPRCQPHPQNPGPK